MTAKDIVVRPIAQSVAASFIKHHHYSGYAVRNSQLSIGVFLGGVLGGAMQLGPPLDRSRVLGLVDGTKWGGMVELNRMAFSDALPRNSESRALGVVFRALRRTRPLIEWVLSFSDATRCGDGAIYRASGFVLTDIKENESLARLPRTGRVVHEVSLKSSPLRPIDECGGKSFLEVTGGAMSWQKFIKGSGAEVLRGFQLRYLRPLNQSVLARLTCPVIPFSEIDARGARMYRGAARA